MKKSFVALLVLFTIVFAASSCIRIIINPTEESQKFESSIVESETESESDPESETEQVPDVIDPTPFIGVFASNTESEPRLLIRDDLTAVYYEFASTEEARVKGIAGSVVPTNKGVAFTFSGADDLDGATAVMKGADTFDFTCGNDTIEFKRAEWDEETLAFISEERVDLLNGVLRDLEDGQYSTNQVASESDIVSGESSFTTAKIENNVLIIHGYVGKYDASWNLTVFGNGEVKLPLLDECVILQSGGTEPDQEITVESFNESFETFTGLGISFTMKNGAVTEILRVS